MEHATITVIPGREQDFLQAFPDARAVIEQAPGFRWLELLRGVEEPSTFALRVCWETLEDHVPGFRESGLFPRWRAVIGPFFAAPPVVSHHTPEISRS